MTDTTDSLCIDAGDPADEVGSEPAPNGGRINIGADGGTADASRSPSGRILTLLSPDGGEVWRGEREILWLSAGGGWGAGDTVRLEVSADGGATWRAIPAATALGCGAGRFLWDTRTTRSGVQYRVRVICNQTEAVRDASGANFMIHNTPLAYFVNDTSTTGDVYCTAIGMADNDGLTSATPQLSIQSILDTYDLEPGDTIFVDAGNYYLSQDITISRSDEGSADGCVHIKGAPRGTILRRSTQEGNSSCLHVAGASYISIEGLDCRDSCNGICVDEVNAPSNNCIIENNRISGCTYGVYMYPDFLRPSPCSIHNNILYNNATAIYIDSGASTIINNTIVGTGYGYRTTWGGQTLNNNIIDISGTGHYGMDAGIGSITSDYNDIAVSADAATGCHYYMADYTLKDWQAATGQDLASISQDPLFADPVNGDFHLKSTGGRWDPASLSWQIDTAYSQCIDRGDPATAIGEEPEPNGRRINLGAYGGTAEASKSPMRRLITIVSPNGGEVWRGIRSINWFLTGQAWQTTDTVSLFYSANSGVDWTAISDGTGILARGGQFKWNMDGLTSGTQYRVKAVCDQDNSIMDTSDGDFTLLKGGIYYVNDSSTLNDDFCTTAGSPAYDGLTPSTPKNSIQAVLDAYDLDPGDTIFVYTRLCDS